jgi:membrane protein YdbS with pleckstrin-like domain
VLARASTRKNCLVHISADSVIVVKEKTAVFVLQTKFRFLHWKFNIIKSLYIVKASFHHLHRTTPMNVSSYTLLKKKRKT